MKRPTNLADIAALYLNTAFVGAKPSTVRNSREYVTAFVLFIGAGQFIEKGKASNELYAEWYAECHKRWSGHTPELAAICTSRFMNWMERNEYISNNPHKSVQKAKSVKSKPRIPFTKEEYEALKEASKGNVMHWAIICGNATGMAIGDAALLTWDEVDFDGMMVRRNRQKTGTLSSIPILAGSDFHETLKEKFKLKNNFYPNDPAKGLYYVDPDLAIVYMRSSNGLTQNGNIHTRFNRIREKAGVDKRKTFHNFRATMCSALANSGISTPLACAITGHTDGNVFKDYVRVDDQALKESLYKAVMKP